MKTYTVQIAERYINYVAIEVQAENEDKAISIAEDLYAEGNYNEDNSNMEFIEWDPGFIFDEDSQQ